MQARGRHDVQGPGGYAHSESGSPSGADVVLYAIDGWTHQWPGRHFTGKLSAEDPLRDFDAAEIIWHFFKIRNTN
ncbi:MAG: hypothetical protein K9K62_03070 [Desulfobacteraceae bacterium]|nr:hypothetical protein [Desulfobacteraceae bacterium]